MTVLLWYPIHCLRYHLFSQPDLGDKLSVIPSKKIRNLYRVMRTRVFKIITEWIIVANWILKLVCGTVFAFLNYFCIWCKNSYNLCNVLHFLRLCDKVCQLLATLSPSISVSSTIKTGRHDITEILLRVALNTINQTFFKILIKTNQHTYPSYVILILYFYYSLSKRR